MTARGKNGRGNGNGKNGNGRNGKKHHHSVPLSQRPQEAAPKDVDDEMLRTYALELRRDGSSYRAIAAALTQHVAMLHAEGKVREARSIGKDVAHRLVTEALSDLRAVNAESADEVRQLEVERLDKWLERLNLGTSKGTPRTIDTMLRVSERRARLLGLDAEASHRLRVVGASGGPLEIGLVDARAVLDAKLLKLAEALSAGPGPEVPAPPILPAHAASESHAEAPPTPPEAPAEPRIEEPPTD